MIDVEHQINLYLERARKREVENHNKMEEGYWKICGSDGKPLRRIFYGSFIRAISFAIGQRGFNVLEGRLERTNLKELKDKQNNYEIIKNHI